MWRCCKCGWECGTDRAGSDRYHRTGNVVGRSLPPPLRHRRSRLKNGNLAAARQIVEVVDAFVHSRVAASYSRRVDNQGLSAMHGHRRRRHCNVPLSFMKSATTPNKRKLSARDGICLVHDHYFTTLAQGQGRGNAVGLMSYRAAFSDCHSARARFSLSCAYYLLRYRRLGMVLSNLTLIRRR